MESNYRSTCRGRIGNLYWVNHNCKLGCKGGWINVNYLLLWYANLHVWQSALWNDNVEKSFKESVSPQTGVARVHTNKQTTAAETTRHKKNLDFGNSFLFSFQYFISIFLLACAWEYLLIQTRIPLKNSHRMKPDKIISNLNKISRLLACWAKCTYNLAHCWNYSYSCRHYFTI